ncbi:DNA-3-methyladenine glycosylase family protein [Aureimonas populi]|uniref:DNA-3-methyladenine glycosylase II n=1 Tax=Aureimonas populi TaxID=1701758 RepID=A0ABW5CKZ6_9HYPH|nr:DNA-3-methyladenine glycosylase 2 family protein [Aureimonas populi]
MIRDENDIAAALVALEAADPRLGPVIARAGTVPLRRSAGGLGGLCATIVAQQVSRASADAIFARLSAAVDLSDHRALLAATDETLVAAGLSRAKQRTLRAIAAAVADGRLDLAGLAQAEAGAAIGEMTAVHGIGPWTAECHLLFAHGHPDVFPAGDLALQIAVAHGLGLAERPKEKALRREAERWAPHRAVAARLFWAYYHAITNRDAAPAGGSVISSSRNGGKPAARAVAATRKASQSLGDGTR